MQMVPLFHLCHNIFGRTDGRTDKGKSTPPPKVGTWKWTDSCTGYEVNNRSIRFEYLHTFKCLMQTSLTIATIAMLSKCCFLSCQNVFVFFVFVFLIGAKKSLVIKHHGQLTYNLLNFLYGFAHLPFYGTIHNHFLGDIRIGKTTI